MKTASFLTYFLFFMALPAMWDAYRLNGHHEPGNAASKHPGPKQIVWEETTLQRIAPPDSAAFYPRMTQLKNGTLLLAYATNGNIVIARSDKEGKDWTAPQLVASKRDRVNMDTPDLLQLKNGAIVLCYATRPQGALRGNPDSTKRFEIRTRVSSDNGMNWADEKVLYRAGSSFGDGCWEPSLVQLPSGEVQLFFADEGPYTLSKEQNISMLQSPDNGNSWSVAPRIISFREGSRDGMPVPLWLESEKKIVVVIEDPGKQNFKPYVIRSAINGKWDKTIGAADKDRTYALEAAIKDSIYAGAPYLRQVSTGETILSYQSTEGRGRNRDNNAIMRVAIGDRHARNFGQVSVPFKIAEGFSALWNSLCVLKDDQVIALTSTNGYSKRRSEVWMIKGRLSR